MNFYQQSMKNNWKKSLKISMINSNNFSSTTTKKIEMVLFASLIKLHFSTFTHNIICHKMKYYNIKKNLMEFNMWYKNKPRNHRKNNECGSIFWVSFHEKIIFYFSNFIHHENYFFQKKSFTFKDCNQF